MRFLARSIESRTKVHACMAYWWNKTKKETVLRIRLGSDQARSRCLVALSKRWKLAVISNFPIGLISSSRWEQDTERKRRPSNDRVPGEQDREINSLIDVLGTRTPSAALQTIESAAGSEIGPNSPDSGARKAQLPSLRAVRRCASTLRSHSRPGSGENLWKTRQDYRNSRRQERDHTERED